MAAPLRDHAQRGAVSHQVHHRLPNRFIPLQTEAEGAERRSPRTRADSVEGREAARRRVDWELEIESLGRRETELRGNQLRLVREQAATFLRDLKALQSEVMTLRSRQDTLHQDCLTAAELRTQEVKDAVETERREREGTNLDFSQRLTGLEADVAGLGNAINGMRQQVREVETTVVNPLQELKEALSKEVAEREVLAGRVQRFCGDHEELQSAAEIHRTSTDKEHAALNERMNSLETNFRGMEAHRTALEDVLRQVRLDVDTNNSTLTQRLVSESTSRASIQDHQCYLERLLSDSSNKQTADVEATSASLEQIRSRLASCESYKAKQEIDLAKFHSVCNDLDGRLCSFGDRAFLLESHAKSTRDEAMSRVQEHAEHLENLTIMSDECVKELEALKGSMDSQQISLKERFSNLEKTLSDFSGARERDLQATIESIQGSIQQQTSALERERALREEADAEHVAALEKMSTSQAYEKLQERVIALETTSQETSKKRAEDSSELTIEMERLRERVSNCEAHKEGLSSLEALQRDLATRHLESVQELESLRSAQRRLDGEAKLRDTRQSSLSERLERLDELVSNIRDATGRHAALTDEVVLVKRLFHEASTRQKTEMEELRAMQSKHTQELDAVQAETRLAVSSHGQALNLARAATEDVKMSVGRDLKAKEEALESLRAEHARLAGETSLLTSSHHSTTERLSRLVADSEQRQTALAQHLDVITHSADDAAQRQLKEMEEVRAVQLTHSKNHEAMQAEARQTADVHGQALAAVRGALEELRVSVGQDLKAAEEALQRLKAEQSCLAVESSSLATHCSKSAEQMANIEGLVGEASRRQAINAETTREKLDQLDSRVCSCESHEARHGSDLATLTSTNNELAERLRSATTRLSVCEDTATSTRDGITSMGKELESLHSLQLRLDGEVKLHETRQSSLSDRMDRTDEVSAQHAALTKGRIEAVERTLNTAVDRHHNDVESLRVVLTQHGSELEGAREARSALEARHSSSEAKNSAFEDRLTPLEVKLRKVEEALAQEEAEVGSKLTALAQEADSHTSKHQTLADTVATMQDLHSKQLEGVLMRTQSFSEALDREASDIRAVCHRQTEDLELLRKAHGRELAAVLSSLEEVHKEIQEESTTREAGDCTLADESAQTRFLAEQLRGDLDEELRGAAARYSDLEARLSQNQDLALTVEKGFIDFAGKHSEELQALKDSHDFLSSETKVGHNRLASSVDQDRESRTAFSKALQERLLALETLQRDTASVQLEHTEDIEALKALQTALRACDERQRQEQKNTWSRMLDMEGSLKRIKEAWLRDPEGLSNLQSG